MDLQSLNWPAVIAAAASAFLLGGIWYGPLFKQAWCREAGVDSAAPSVRHPAQVFGFAFLLSLIAAITFALFLGPQADMHRGVQAGARSACCSWSPASASTICSPAAA